MVLARFLPRDEQFFDHFREAAANAAEAAHLLADLFERGDDVERRVHRLRDLEHRGDEITHRIFNALNSTFVTPLDRDDISDLASRFDDFVDDIEEVGRRLVLYRLEDPPEPARLLTRILAEQADVLVEAMPHLERVAKEGAALRRAFLEVHRLENEADDALSQALAHLYDGVTEVPALITAMRWGELLGLLEDATDRAEDVANTLEGIMLKNA
jgi:predicted phosphate transport protein (TIGR00153 family)